LKIKLITGYMMSGKVNLLVVIFKGGWSTKPGRHIKMAASANHEKAGNRATINKRMTLT
jgi:hypothetical protein